MEEEEEEEDQEEEEEQEAVKAPTSAQALRRDNRCCGYVSNCQHHY